MSNNGGKRKVKVEAENVGRRASGVPMKFKKTLYLNFVFILCSHLRRIKRGLRPHPRKRKEAAVARPRRRQVDLLFSLFNICLIKHLSQ